MSYFVLAFLFHLLMVAAGAQQPEAKTEEQADIEQPLAEMTGYQLTEEELNRLLGLLPESTREQLSSPEAREQFIKTWMEIMAIYNEAIEAGLQNTQEVSERLEFFEKQILVEQYRTGLLKDVSASEEELEEYYQEHREDFRTPAAVRVSHILLPSQEDAEQALADLAAGETFEEIAKEQSQDPGSRERGGELGWLTAGRTIPEFEQVAFSLEPGEVSSAVQTDFGWHIIRVSEKRPAAYRTFEDVRALVSEQVLSRKRQETLERKTEDLLRKYNVKFH